MWPEILTQNKLMPTEGVKPRSAHSWTRATGGHRQVCDPTNIWQTILQGKFTNLYCILTGKDASTHVRLRAHTQAHTHAHTDMYIHIYQSWYAVAVSKNCYGLGLLENIFRNPVPYVLALNNNIDLSLTQDCWLSALWDINTVRQGPLLLIWFNFNPSIDW